MVIGGRTKEELQIDLLHAALADVREHAQIVVSTLPLLHSRITAPHERAAATKVIDEALDEIINLAEQAPRSE